VANFDSWRAITAYLAGVGIAPQAPAIAANLDIAAVFARLRQFPGGEFSHPLPIQRLFSGDAIGFFHGEPNSNSPAI
jgi:hypothetical protein